MLSGLGQNKAILFILGAFMMSLAAIVNQYPIVYSDTSTYLASGFELQTPIDRPITYGLFLRVFSLNGFSLWTVVFTQGLILSFLLLELLEFCLPKTFDCKKIFLALILFLSLFTSISWLSSQLISDVFTPVMILSFLILVIRGATTTNRKLIYLIFVIATCMHMSHITFNLILIVLILFVRRLNFLGIREVVMVRPLLICFCLTLLSISTMGSALSKSKHGFLMGALIEHGIVKEYLDDNCDKFDYKLCEYKDSLPKKGIDFLWNQKSAFYKMGGWKGTKEEFNEIIFHTLTSPKYIALHIQASIIATGDQLTKFNVGDGNGVYLNGSELYKRMNIYFPRETSQYESSRQNNRAFGFLDWYNTILYFVVILSLIGLIIILVNFRTLDKHLFSIILFISLSVLLNSWTCGTFANALDRLGSKVIWLIPLAVSLGGLSFLKKQK